MVVCVADVAEGVAEGRAGVEGLVAPAREELVKPKPLLVFPGVHGDEGSSCVGEPNEFCRCRFAGGSSVSMSSSGPLVIEPLFRAEMELEEAEEMEGE